MNKKRLFAGFIVIVLSVGFIHGARFLFSPQGKVILDKRISNRSKGTPSAPTWIIEYMDYQCPSCQRAFFMLEEYLNKYPNQLYLQVRFYPLKMHAHGLKSALYAECAAKQNKFWSVHRLLFSNQNQWDKLPDSTQAFNDYAAQSGMNLKTLDACLGSPLTQEAVLNENLESQKLGVKSTPSFFLNGRLVVGYKEIRAELKQLFPDFVYSDPSDIPNAK